MSGSHLTKIGCQNSATSNSHQRGKMSYYLPVMPVLLSLTNPEVGIWGSFQYKDNLSRYWNSHYKNKTIMRPSFCNRNSYTCKKLSFYWNSLLHVVKSSQKYFLNGNFWMNSLYNHVYMHRTWLWKMQAFLKGPSNVQWYWEVLKKYIGIWIWFPNYYFCCYLMKNLVPFYMRISCQYYDVIKRNMNSSHKFNTTGVNFSWLVTGLRQKSARATDWNHSYTNTTIYSPFQYFFYFSVYCQESYLVFGLIFVHFAILIFAFCNI